MFICVLCLEESNGRPIKYEQGNPNVRERLIECIPELDTVMLQGEGVCPDCFQELLTCHHFRARCLQIKRDRENNVLDTKPKDDESLAVMSASDLTKNVIKVLHPKKKLKTNINKKGNGLINTIEYKPKTPFSKEFLQRQIGYGATCSSGRGGNIQRGVVQLYTKYGTEMRRVGKNFMIDNQVPQQLSYEGRELLKSLGSEEMDAFTKIINAPCTPVSCKSCKIRLKCIHEQKYHEGLFHKGLTTIRCSDFIVVCEICASYVNHTYLHRHLEYHSKEDKEIENKLIVVD